MLLAEVGLTGIAWSSYLGGSAGDGGRGVAIDSMGNAWITGSTSSSSWASGGFDTSHNGGSDAFVAKINADGTLGWISYLGGSSDDYGYGIALDGSGNAWVTGSTSSSGWAAGGFDTSPNSSVDAFVAKINADGTLAWSSYLGGSSDDCGYGIAVDGSGNVWVTGFSSVADWASGGFDTTPGGSLDGFVAKINANGTLAWSSYLGGSSYDYGRSIAVDGSGNAWVTGETSSSDWASSGFEASYCGYYDAFVTKINADGTLAWNRYLGGTGAEYGYAIAIDAAGSAWITGETWSAGWVSGGFDTTYAGTSTDGFVAKVSADGALAWSSYLGGVSQDAGRGIAVDASSVVWVTGSTYSFDFASGGFDTTYGGSYDGFLAKISPGGTLAFASYMGGSGSEIGYGVAVDSSGNAWVTGNTGSSGWVYGGFDTSLGGSADAFVLRTRPNLPPSDVTLSNNAVLENQVPGQVVGSFSGIDPDAGEAFTYGFVGGGTDWMSFNIVANQLVTAAVLDYETKSSYSFSVRMTDAGGATVDKPFTISVTDLDEVPVRQVGRWTGVAYDVRVMGDYAYVAGYSNGLQIVDVSNPTAPVLVGSYNTSGYARGVAVAGNYAYVADDTAGLQIIDVSNPANPTRVGGYDTSGTAYGVSVAGNYAYVADYGGDLQVIDISNPVAPVRVGGFNPPSLTFGVSVVGHYAYLAAGSFYGFQVVDISNPAAPAAVGSCQITGTALALSIAGNYAYVAAQSGGLHVVDISDPAAPHVVGSYDTPGYPYAVSVAGNQAYVADYDKGLQILDISNPTAPIRVGSYDTSGNARGVSVIGGHVYIADESNGLVILEKGYAPTDIQLAGSTIAENQPLNALVGTLSAVDQTLGDSFLYRFVAGTGGEDNAAFQIVGNELRTAAVFDYETRNTYSVRVRVTDADGLTFEKVFVINVSNVVEQAPVVTEVATPQGPISDGALIASSTLSLAGTSEPGMLIRVYDDASAGSSAYRMAAAGLASGSVIGSTYADSAGAWMIELTGLGEGQHQLRIGVFDSLENVLFASSPIRFAVDTVAPQITSVQINSGAAQRSMVRRLEVLFSEPVRLLEEAITVRLADGSPVPNTTISVSSTDQQDWVVSFSGTAAPSGSLADGIYELIVAAAGVEDLAGNALGGDYRQKFHRLFGDVDGNKVVNASDYTALRNCFDTHSTDAGFNDALDYENNLVINASDLTQFRKRFGVRYVY